MVFFLSDEVLRIGFFYLLEYFLYVNERGLIITSTHTLATPQPAVAIGSDFIGLKLEEPAQNELTVEELGELVAVLDYLVKHFGDGVVLLLNLRAVD